VPDNSSYEFFRFQEAKPQSIELINSRLAKHDVVNLVTKEPRQPMQKSREKLTHQSPGLQASNKGKDGQLILICPFL
jgi:hypothetical protein